MLDDFRRLPLPVQTAVAMSVFESTLLLLEKGISEGNLQSAAAAASLNDALSQIQQFGSQRLDLLKPGARQQAVSFLGVLVKNTLSAISAYEPEQTDGDKPQE